MYRASVVACALIAAGPARVYADRWVVAEAPAAVAVSGAQSGAFRAGMMPAVGLYTGDGPAALGIRMRAGVLRNGPAPGDHLSDPGLGGLGAAGVALRLGAHGLWIEAVAGGGLTGRDLVPVVEAGAGWSFAIGSVDIGPSARIVHLAAHEPFAAFGSADLVLIGVDVQFGKAHPRRASVAHRPPAPPPVLIERDADRVVDSDASCETDSRGCKLAEHIYLKGDRIVLEDRVLFDVGRAHVKSEGRDAIGELIRIWRRHPEWKRMSIEGHTDMRGSDAYNLELSRLRAERVRDVFVQHGVDPARLGVVGHGRSRPIDPGTDEEAHQHNRRVEFVIERQRLVEPAETP